MAGVPGNNPREKHLQPNFGVEEAASSASASASTMGRKKRQYVPKVKGCYECSKRRINCDRTEPECQKCVSKGLSCSGLGQGYTFVDGFTSGRSVTRKSRERAGPSSSNADYSPIDAFSQISTNQFDTAGDFSGNDLLGCDSPWGLSDLPQHPSQPGPPSFSDFPLPTSSSDYYSSLSQSYSNLPPINQFDGADLMQTTGLNYSDAPAEYYEEDLSTEENGDQNSFGYLHATGPSDTNYRFDGQG